MTDKEFLRKEYHLTTNPFYDVSFGPKFVDRKDIREELYGKLTSFVEGEIESPQMFWITGSYGLGKTFLLFEIDEDIKQKRSKYIKSEKMLSCYIRMVPTKIPRDYLLYVYQEIINKLRFDTFKDLFKEFEDSAKGKQSDVLLNSTSNDFRNAFARLGSEFRDLAWKYFSGEYISSSEMKDIEVTKRIDNGNVAKSILMDFLKLLKVLDYKALVVLIDEFENIFTLAGSKKTAEILTTFREIYDEINNQIYKKAKIANGIFIFATASSTDEDVVTLIQKQGPGNQAFIDRVRSWHVNLRPFERKYVRELIQLKIEKYRDKETDNDILPFKEEFIDYITKITGGNPRYILQYTATILDIASEKGYKTIGEKEAQEIVAEKNLG